MQPALSVKEVAQFAGVPERAVNKAVEEKIIAPRRRAGMGRARLALPIHAVPYAALVGKLALRLSLGGKRELARALKSRPVRTMTLEPIEIAPAVTVDVSNLVEPDLAERAANYARCRDRIIEEDAEILGGTPVIRGTRISVYSLLGRVDHGDSIDDIIEDYRDLDAETVQTALTYARTHPLLGRPGGRPWERAA